MYETNAMPESPSQIYGAITPTPAPYDRVDIKPHIYEDVDTPLN